MDEFSGSRLPDLPNAGYSTRAEKALSDTVMTFIRALERDRIVLLKIVIDGPQKFKSVCGKRWRGARVPSELLDAVFGYLQLLAGDNPRGQYERLTQMQVAPPWIGDNASNYAKVRDSLEFVAAVNAGSKSTRDLRRKR